MWKAKFKDGSTLQEFDDSGKNEVLFGKVMARVTELETLSILLTSSKSFTIRFTDGRFTLSNNGVDIHIYGFDFQKYDIFKLTNIRPIYFVRETVDFNIGARKGLQVASQPQINFIALGFQANYENKNIKRYLLISPGGDSLIKDE
jgi:hypothetical protein